MNSKSGSLRIQRPSLDISDATNVIEEDDEDDEDEEEEVSQDLPSFKSVIFKGNGNQLQNHGDKNLFYDAEKDQYVNVDNFAFTEDGNYFEKSQSDASSSLALLDSRILDETSANLDDTKMIVDELKRNIVDGASSSSQPNSLDVSFDLDSSKPKIKSPREKTPPKRKTSPLSRKFSQLSTESQKLPSKSSEESATSIPSTKFVKKKQAKNNTTAPGQVQKRLNLDKNSKKLGKNKSHSTSNLHKLSVKDYHESFQKDHRRLSSVSASGVMAADENLVKSQEDYHPDRSSSYDSLYNMSLKDLAGKKADYSHVQSKVRQYIYSGSQGSSIQSRPSSKQQNFRQNVEDNYGKSFVLSPGRKSLSMSNIVQDDFYFTSRRNSCKSDLKSFLSAKNLNDLHVSVKNSATFANAGGATEKHIQNREIFYQNDQVSRLLDDLSDPENIANDDGKNPIINQEEVVCEVEDLLQLAMDERKGKLEAIKVLAELKQNYDHLQKKFAAAETTIDKLRFGGNDVIVGNESEQNDILEENDIDKNLHEISLSSLHHMLTEIQEQLYGLEILCSDVSSFSSLDKKSTLSKLRVTYDSIHEHTLKLVNKGTTTNSEYMRCLTEVGEKLCIMEVNQEERASDYDNFVKDIIIPVDNSDELDPVAKVAQWQQNKAPIQQQTNIPSGYGSVSTSPTLPVLQRPDMVTNNTAKKTASSERSSFEQGSPGDLDSGCPGSERSPSTLFQHNFSRNLSHVAEEAVTSLTSSEPIRELHSITDLSSDEKEDQFVDMEILKLKESLKMTSPKKDSSNNSTLVLEPPMTTPRGSHTILAQQINQEIIELRNIYDDHREEMLSLISDQQQTKKLTASAGCSPIVFESQKSPKRSSRRRNGISKNQCISDSEESHDVQEERRAEFEKFRNQKKLKRKPQFAIGQPLSNDNLKISALFPRLEAGQDEAAAGRHVPTIDGDQVFIPKLNLDDQWSIEDHVKSLDSIKVSDKSCQAEEEEIPQILPKPRKTKKKSKDLKSLLDTLQMANRMASQLKSRSKNLLSELQYEMDLHIEEENS